MAECCPQKLLVKFLSLDFVQDHRMLKDAWETSDKKPEWRDTGALYVAHDWSPDLLPAGKDPNPVSYSAVQKLQPDNSNPVSSSTSKRGTPVYDKANRNRMQVQVHLQITPDCACPEKCQLYGIGQEQYAERKILFESGWIMLAPSPDRLVTLTEEPFSPLRVGYIDLKIDWYLKSHPSSSQQSFPQMFNLESTVNRRYVTFGKPILWGDPESGVTLRRMDRSVEWVGNSSTNEHPYVIKYLFGRYKAYTLVDLTRVGNTYRLDYNNLSQKLRQDLKDNPDTLKRLGDFGWSSYFNDDVGAWPAAEQELAKYGAECQAICRLVIGILRQLGSPVELSLAFATADFSHPDTAIVDGHTGNVPTGPDSSKSYALVDAEVTKGTKYIAPILDPSDNTMKVPPGKYEDTNDVGWNNFEAYLRYHYKENGRDKTRWYGGGVGEHEGNPIHVFWGMAEYEEGSELIFGQLVQYKLITRVYQYD